MTVKILKRSAVPITGSFRLVNPGEIHEVSEQDARTLVAADAAEIVEAQPSTN